MPDISADFLGMKFKNPIFTAAGPAAGDLEILKSAAKGGAGALVTKTISVAPGQIPKPCIQKISVGLLNCETWSEKHYEEWTAQIYPELKKSNLPLIASIGYSPEDVSKLGPLVEKTADAIEFSIHYLGTDFGPVMKVVAALKDSVKIPIIAKISPHYDVAKLAKKLEEGGVDGIAAINSVGLCLSIGANGKPFLAGENGYGWLSGPAIKPTGLRCVSQICKEVEIPVIGVGGISNGTDAAEYIMAGASAVQVCTAAIINGPQIYGKIAGELNDFLEKNNYSSLADIKGIALR